MQYTDKYWNDRLEDFKHTPNPPECVKRAIKRVYSSYPAECMPQGLCDPMYIMNVIALELGIGDGQGNFYLPQEVRHE
jgi:hypothetical protein